MTENPYRSALGLLSIVSLILAVGIAFAAASGASEYGYDGNDGAFVWAGWLAVFGIGRPNEFDDEVYLRANLICVTSKTHELDYYDRKLDQPLIRLSQGGAIAWDSVAELGDFMSRKVAVPDLSRSLIVFRDSQGGYGDLALAAWTYGEARRKGLGQEISTE